MARQVIILCTGRCGSTYTAKVVQDAGYKFGHEVVEAAGGIGWNFILPSEKKRHFSKIKDAVFLHQFRPALPCISSILSYTDYHWQRLAQNNLYTDGTKIYKAMRFWLDWNKRCIELSKSTYCITNKEKTQNTLQKYFKKALNFDAVSKKENTRKHPQLMWEDLERIDISLTSTIKDFNEFLTLRQWTVRT